MFLFRINKISALFSEIIILAIVFFVPIFFSPPFFITSNVFELNKVVIFKILTLFLGLVTIIRLINDSDFRISVKNNLLLYRKYFIIPLIFIILLGISTLFSIDPVRSLKGLYDRQMGLISYLYFFLFFLLLLINIRSFKEIKRILYAAVGASLLVSLYGIAQRLGFDFMAWSESTSATMRITSTFGQPNYLAIYLLLVWPLSVYLAIKSKNFIFRYIFIAIAILEIISLILTYSVSGWLSFAGGTLAISILFLFKFYNKFKDILALYKRRVIIAFIIFVALLAGIIYGLSDIGFIQAKIKPLLDMRGSAGTRVLYWQASKEAFMKKPILGYGPETQWEVLSTYHKPDWDLYSYINTQPNRAHNLILDTLLTGGLIGLFALVVLYGLFIRLLYNNIKNNRRVLLSFMLLFAVISYIIALMLNFLFITVSVYWWLYLALIIFISKQKPDSFQEGEIILDQERTTAKDLTNKRINKKYLIPIKIFAVVIVGLGVFNLANGQVKVLISDHYFFGMKQSLKYNDFYDVLEFYDYIDETLCTPNMYNEQTAIYISGFLEQLSDPDYRRPGAERLRQILPYVKGSNYTNTHLRARIYSALASDEDMSYFKLSEDEFKRVIRATPDISKNYREIANMYRRWGKYELAQKNYDLAFEKLPDLNNPALNYLHKDRIKYELYLDYSGLAKLNADQKDFKKALEHSLLAYEYNKKDLSVLLKIANYYAVLGSYEEAISYIIEGYKINPADYQWPFALGELYYLQGEYEIALRYANLTKEMVPNARGIQSLIDKILERMKLN